MQIETVALNKIIPYIRNPRKNENAIEKVASSIHEFGFRQPIVVDSENVIIAGHTRFEAAKRLGLDVVPIHVADGLTEQQAKAYRIADNRVGQEAEWDYDLLKLELEELDNPELTGFDEDELNGILAEVGEGLTDPDEVPEVPVEPVTVPGDLWELGEHRLVCGDGTIKSDVNQLLDGQNIDLILTDPPYCSGGFQESGKAGGSVGSTSNKKIIVNDRLSTRGYSALLKSVFGNIKSNFIYSFTDWRMWVYLFDIFESSTYSVKSMIVWDKGTPGMGRGWRAQHEIIMWGCNIIPPYDRKYGGAGNVIQTKRTGNNLHTTEKPVELLEKLIINTPFVKTIADPFLGSGTTLIACQMTGRKCFGIEIDPQYCDVIITRWSEFTGKDDLLLNGKPYKWSERKIKKAA